MINYGNKTYQRTTKPFSTINLNKDNACGSGVEELITYARNNFSKDEIANFALNGISDAAFCQYFLAKGNKFVDWLIGNGYLSDVKAKAATTMAFPLGTAISIDRTGGDYVLARMKVGYDRYAWALINVESGKAKLDPTVFTGKTTTSLTAVQFKTLLGKDVGEYGDIVANMAD
jgi:hypothetical protein